jgi:hypothetical protein
VPALSSSTRTINQSIVRVIVALSAFQLSVALC